VNNLVRAPDEVLAAGWADLRQREARDVEAGIARIRLARRLGAVCMALPTAQGRRDANGPPTKSEVLARLSIPRQRAAEWELLAALDDETVDAFIALGRRLGEVSLRGLLALTRPRRRAKGARVHNYESPERNAQELAAYGRWASERNDRLLTRAHEARERESVGADRLLTIELRTRADWLAKKMKAAA
jgi:hypothetical protein